MIPVAHFGCIFIASYSATGIIAKKESLISALFTTEIVHNFAEVVITLGTLSR